MAKCWLCNQKYGVVNMITSAVCWGIWKLRNALCFQGVDWRNVKQVWEKVLPMLKCWSVGATEIGGWLRSCTGIIGETNLKTREDFSHQFDRNCRA
jgi:hypothetical protein